MLTIRLTKGVTGGFMPAIARKKVVIEKNSQVQISNWEDNVSASATVNDGSIEAKIQEIVHKVSKLPTEIPIGAQDIYGFDVMIEIISGNKLLWKNVPNQGCNIIPSEVQPDAEQVETFQNAMEAILNMADYHAVVK
jgi:hypothetical protein